MFRILPKKTSFLKRPLENFQQSLSHSLEKLHLAVIETFEKSFCILSEQLNSNNAEIAKNNLQSIPKTEVPEELNHPLEELAENLGTIQSVLKAKEDNMNEFQTLSRALENFKETHGTFRETIDNILEVNNLVESVENEDSVFIQKLVETLQAPPEVSEVKTLATLEKVKQVIDSDLSQNLKSIGKPLQKLSQEISKRNHEYTIKEAEETKGQFHKMKLIVASVKRLSDIYSLCEYLEGSLSYPKINATRLEELVDVKAQSALCVTKLEEIQRQRGTKTFIPVIESIKLIAQKVSKFVEKPEMLVDLIELADRKTEEIETSCKVREELLSHIQNLKLSSRVHPALASLIDIEQVLIECEYSVDMLLEAAPQFKALTILLSGIISDTTHISETDIGQLSIILNELKCVLQDEPLIVKIEQIQQKMARLDLQTVANLKGALYALLETQDQPKLEPPLRHLVNALDVIETAGLSQIIPDITSDFSRLIYTLQSSIENTRLSSTESEVFKTLKEVTQTVKRAVLSHETFIAIVEPLQEILGAIASIEKSSGLLREPLSELHSKVGRFQLQSVDFSNLQAPLEALQNSLMNVEEPLDESDIKAIEKLKVLLEPIKSLSVAITSVQHLLEKPGTKDVEIPKLDKALESFKVIINRMVHTCSKSNSLVVTLASLKSLSSIISNIQEKLDGENRRDIVVIRKLRQTIGQLCSNIDALHEEAQVAPSSSRNLAVTIYELEEPLNNVLDALWSAKEEITEQTEDISVPLAEKLIIVQKPLLDLASVITSLESSLDNEELVDIAIVILVTALRDLSENARLTLEVITVSRFDNLQTPFEQLINKIDQVLKIISGRIKKKGPKCHTVVAKALKQPLLQLQIGIGKLEVHDVNETVQKGISSLSCLKESLDHLGESLSNIECQPQAEDTDSKSALELSKLAEPLKRLSMVVKKFEAGARRSSLVELQAPVVLQALRSLKITIESVAGVVFKTPTFQKLAKPLAAVSAQISEIVEEPSHFSIVKEFIEAISGFDGFRDIEELQQPLQELQHELPKIVTVHEDYLQSISQLMTSVQDVISMEERQEPLQNLKKAAEAALITIPELCEPITHLIVAADSIAGKAKKTRNDDDVVVQLREFIANLGMITVVNFGTSIKKLEAAVSVIEQDTDCPDDDITNVANIKQAILTLTTCLKQLGVTEEFQSIETAVHSLHLLVAETRFANICKPVEDLLQHIVKGKVQKMLKHEIHHLHLGVKSLQVKTEDLKQGSQIGVLLNLSKPLEILNDVLQTLEKDEFIEQLRLEDALALNKLQNPIKQLTLTVTDLIRAD